MAENLQFALEFQCIFIQIIHFLQEKKIASNFVLESMLFFFKRYRRMAKPNLCNLIIQNYVNQKGNDVSYFGNSSCPRSQPHRYKYSYLLLHRYNLPRFRKDQNHSRRYLKKRNKRRKFRLRETEEWLNQTYVTSLSTRM